MGDIWTDVELERPALDAEALSDEEIFALDFKAYNARLELRQEQQRATILQRYGVTAELAHFAKLARA